MPVKIQSQDIVDRLVKLSSPDEVEKVSRFFRGDDAGNQVLGVSISKVFPIAKEFMHASQEVIEELLESKFYEVRMCAVSIMDFQARAKTTTRSERKALFDLYLRRHDRINNWDLVDRAAPHVIGGYLTDKPRDILYELACSKDPWERRTAIVSTYFFIRAGEIEDTFQIAQLLLDDEHELVQKAVGSWLREAGKKGPRKLIAFLEENGASMSRSTLRSATEKLDKDQRAHLLGTKRKT
jgi:3-methyladenine DNA glycosylase AlkD